MPILDSLKKADLRGVKVLLDKSNTTAKYSGATFMKNAGVPVLIDRKHAIVHNKIFIDGKTIITGSFHFSKNANRQSTGGR